MEWPVACARAFVCQSKKERKKKSTHNGIVDSFQHMLLYFLLVIRIVTISKAVVSKVNPNVVHIECVCLCQK